MMSDVASALLGLYAQCWCSLYCIVDYEYGLVDKPPNCPDQQSLVRCLESKYSIVHLQYVSQVGHIVCNTAVHTALVDTKCSRSCMSTDAITS